ncbi:hypothetical protein BU198_22290 [Streptomyces sp. CBMA156]|nr:hypothetical protein [Streptomyces sp. CBMA156]
MKAWRVVGAAVIVLVMTGGALQTWAMAVQQRTSSSRPYDKAIRGVRLETGNASVRVRAGREGHVVVHQSLDWLVRKPVVSVTIVDGVLTVAMRCRRVLPFADFGCGAEIELEVPAATEVSGSVGSGSVRVEGLSGNVRMELTSGELLLSDTSGDVTVGVTSGQVRGGNLSARRVTVRANSGSVSLNFAKAPAVVDAAATSGSVEMTVPKDSRYAFTSETGSGHGGIDPLLADPGSPNRMHVAVTSGSISVNPSMSVEPSEPVEPPEPPSHPDPTFAEPPSHPDPTFPPRSAP